QQIVKRHEILRSTIEQEENKGGGIQIVHNRPLPIEEITLTDTEDYNSLIKADIHRPFDLRREYPVRIKFYKIQSDKKTTTVPQIKSTLLLINTHHIASDGWSIEIFQKELIAYYEAYINNHTTFSLPALEIQYKDYAAW